MDIQGEGVSAGSHCCFIIRGGSLYLCTNDNSSQCKCVCVSVCVGGWGCSNKTPSSGLPFEFFSFFFIVIVIILWHASYHKTPNYIMKK